MRNQLPVHPDQATERKNGRSGDMASAGVTSSRRATTMASTTGWEGAVGSRLDDGRGSRRALSCAGAVRLIHRPSTLGDCDTSWSSRVPPHGRSRGRALVVPLDAGVAAAAARTPAEGGRFLDVGTGTGATARWLAGRGSGRLRRLRALRARCSASATSTGGSWPPTPAACRSPTALLRRGAMRDGPVPPRPGRLRRPRWWRAGPCGPPRRCSCAYGSRCVKRLRRAHDRVTHAGRRFSRRLAVLLTVNGLTLERSTGAYAFLVPPAAVKTVLEGKVTSSDLDHAGGLGGVGGHRRAERRATGDRPPSGQ